VSCYFQSSFSFVSVPYYEVRITERIKPQHFYFSFTVEKYWMKTGDENYLLTGSRFLGFNNFFKGGGGGGILHIVCQTCVLLPYTTDCDITQPCETFFIIETIDSWQCVVKAEYMLMAEHVQEKCEAMWGGHKEAICRGRWYDDRDKINGTMEEEDSHAESSEDEKKPDEKVWSADHRVNATLCGFLFLAWFQGVLKTVYIIHYWITLSCELHLFPCWCDRCIQKTIHIG